MQAVPLGLLPSQLQDCNHINLTLIGHLNDRYSFKPHQGIYEDICCFIIMFEIQVDSLIEKIIVVRYCELYTDKLKVYNIGHLYQWHYYRKDITRV